MEAAITGRETPQARPRACLDGTKTYGTFYINNINKNNNLLVFIFFVLNNND